MGEMVKNCMMCGALCPTTAPTTAPPVGPPGTCVVWGDPHILTFDKKRVDFYTQGEYWIVKSATVQIQGMYKPTHATSGLSVLKQIAFGGPFMKGHKLIIGTTTATWDNQPVLGGFPATYSNELIQAQYDGNGATMQDGRAGKPLHIIHLTLPLSVNVQINRWMEASEGNYINAKITMPAQPGQDGHCGNFNNNVADACTCWHHWGGCRRVTLSWPEDTSCCRQPPRHKQLSKTKTGKCEGNMQSQGTKVHSINGLPHRCVLWRCRFCWDRRSWGA